MKTLFSYCLHVHIYYNPITSPSLSITVMHHKQQIQSNVNWLIKLSSYHWKGLDAMEGPCWLDLNSDLSYFGIYKGPFPAIKNLMQSVVIQPSTKNNVIFISLLLNFNFEKINKIHYGHNHFISQCSVHFLFATIAALLVASLLGESILFYALEVIPVGSLILRAYSVEKNRKKGCKMEFPPKSSL